MKWCWDSHREVSLLLSGNLSRLYDFVKNILSQTSCLFPSVVSCPLTVPDVDASSCASLLHGGVKAPRSLKLCCSIQINKQVSKRGQIAVKPPKDSCCWNNPWQLQCLQATLHAFTATQVFLLLPLQLWRNAGGSGTSSIFVETFCSMPSRWTLLSDFTVLEMSFGD